MHVATLSVLAAVLVSAGQPVFSEDTWLRLSLGEAYAAAGPWLDADPLLHTAEGPPAPAAWLSDLALHGTERGLGFAGLRLLHVLLAASILALAWTALRRTSGSAVLASLGTTVFAALSAYRLFQLRPHLVSMLTALLLVNLLVCDGRPPSRRRIALAVVLFAVWANAHGGFVLGPVLIGAAAAGAGLAALAGAGPDARARAVRLGLALVLGTAATFANPEGAAPHLLYFVAGDATPGLDVVVDEWAGFALFRPPPPNLPPSLLSWLCVWALALATPVALLVELRRWRRGEPVDLALAALAAVSLVGLLSAVRLAWLAIFPLLLLGHVGSGLGLQRPSRRAGLAAAASAVLLALAFFRFGPWPMISLGVHPARYAHPYPATKSYAHAVWFLRDAGLEGRLFNGYEVGNFLGYWLAPRMKVFVNGSLNLPRPLMEARMRIERRQGAREGESFEAGLDRLEIDVFFATGLPVAPLRNRPSASTTTHLEGVAGWLLVFRTPRSAVYLRDDGRNRANLERVADYYAERGVPFDPARGLELERVVLEGRRWALAHGVLPVHLDRLDAAARARGPAGRAARDHLASLYACLGLYPQAIELDRTRLAAGDPGEAAAGRRLVWSLLHARRFGEARETAERLASRAATDPLAASLVSAARLTATNAEEVAARIPLLPVLTRPEARRVLTGLREPLPRLPAH